MAGATTLSELASAIGVRTEEASVVAELKAGSEEAFYWLIAHYNQPVYSLIYRILDDPSDAADTTQEVFIKVFRGIKGFNEDSSLKTWIYRIAVHEASNHRRWWFRHKARETSVDVPEQNGEGEPMREYLVDPRESPFDSAVHEEVRARVEEELRHVPEPYRTTLILRDLEEMSYEEIAEITETNLGTVKSRLTRGREALKQRLTEYIRQAGPQLGLLLPETRKRPRSTGTLGAAGQLEVTS